MRTTLSKHLLAFSLLILLIYVRSLILTMHPYVGLTWEKLWSDGVYQWLPFSVGLIAIIVFHELMHYVTAWCFRAHPHFCFIWRWLLPCPAVKYDETVLSSQQEQVVFLAPQIITSALLLSLFWLPSTFVLSLVFSHLYMSVFDFAESIAGSEKLHNGRFALTVNYTPVVGLLLTIVLSVALTPYLGNTWSFIVSALVVLGGLVILLFIAHLESSIERLSMILVHIWWFVPLVIVVRICKGRWIKGFEFSDKGKFLYTERFSEIFRGDK